MEKAKTNIENRHYWMDLARILACFAVILIHIQGTDTAVKKNYSIIF